MFRRKIAFVALLVASFAFAACADATGPETADACGGVTQGSDTRC